MTVKDIIKQVRWCVDEENNSYYTDYEDTYFDNIVKAKIGASLRWCALYADAVLLTDGKGSDGTSLINNYYVRPVPTGTLVSPTSSKEITSEDTTFEVVLKDSTYNKYTASLIFQDGSTSAYEAAIESNTATFTGSYLDEALGETVLGIEIYGKDTLPVIDLFIKGCSLPIEYLTTWRYYGKGLFKLPATALRVSRVKSTGWSKGVSTLIEEDSDEYLMQDDETSMATKDRPVVALVRTNPLKIQLFPVPEIGEEVEISIVNIPQEYNGATITDETEIDVPVKMEGAFLYYLAYLVMCAHNDINKASSMLGIAKQQIAITTSE